MLIAHVTFETAAPTARPALAALIAEIADRPRHARQPRLPAVPCRPGEDTGLGVIHEWVDAASFDTYVASPGFAASGRVLRPLMTAPPVSKRFEARLLETVA